MASAVCRRRKISNTRDFRKVEFRSSYVRDDRLYDLDHGDAGLWSSAENAKKKRRHYCSSDCISGVPEHRENGE